MRTQPVKPIVILTKLRPPARRGGLVPRAELVGRLCDTRGYRLAAIQAGAGFGKTSLLSQCYERIRGEQPAAWLSLDASDNDYLRFLAHLLAAIEASGVEAGREFKHLVRFGARTGAGHVRGPAHQRPGWRRGRTCDLRGRLPPAERPRQRAAVIAATPGSPLEPHLAPGQPYGPRRPCR